MCERKKYDEAKAMSDKYYSVAKTDSRFRVLKEEIDKQYEQKQKIEALKTKIAITTDTTALLAHYKMLAELEPDNPEWELCIIECKKSLD